MIVSITGGTGFIGFKLAIHHLAQGDSVRVLSRRSISELQLPDSVDLHYGDLSMDGDLTAFVDNADILYHCAGEIRDTTLMRSVHVDGTLKLIHAASGKVGRWVQLSSVGAYGRVRDGVVEESAPLNPVGMYEKSKVESENLVTAAALNRAFEHVILRPSNVYGAKMTNQSIFNLISIIERGLFFFIGKPKSTVNYIHVDNVVNALVLCGQNPIANGQIYNLSDPIFTEQLVSLIASALKVPIPQLRLPELPVRVGIKLFQGIPGFPLSASRVDALTGRAIYLSDKIQVGLGYRHIVSMEEGLREAVGFWRRLSR